MGDTVLLAEDETALRHCMTFALERDGLEVVEATSGEQAVDLIDKGLSFDALVTDVQMHGHVDGIKLAAHARVVHPNVPVVIIPGNTGGASTPELGEHGAFLAKPFRMATLVSLVRSLMTAYKAAFLK